MQISYNIRNPKGIYATFLCSVVFLGFGIFVPSRVLAARHVVVVVMDGLRPDSVTQEDMPNLFELSKEGTFFSRHHPVYPSSTEVNGSTMVTGGYPEHTSVTSNNEYLPAVELLHPVKMEEEATVRKGDEVFAGRYLLMPTVAEIARQAGMRTVIAGTKPVALLLDRDRLEGASRKLSVNVYDGKSLPRSFLAGLSATTQPFPARTNDRKAPNLGQDAWTTRVLIERLWAEGIPEFSMLWLSDPDYTQHGMGPGSPMARQAIHDSDAQLGLVLKALEAAGVRKEADVLVVSDHGFSTISRNFNLAKALQAGGFDASAVFASAPKPGQVMVVGNSGSACLHVIGHDKSVIARLVAFLQSSDFAGVIFTKGGVDGTFTLNQGGIDGPNAPDILFSMRWTADRSASGMPGEIVSEGVRVAGQGNHTSLSRFDMHNTLIAAGPDFRGGFVDEIASGNVDVAPTVLHLLGLTPPLPLDGRILSEALVDGNEKDAPAAKQTTLEANASVKNGTWRQYLTLTTIGQEFYMDEGNGSFTQGAGN